MRTPGVADPPSAPSEHFVNAYSTSSIAEDKAEVWAALMCYQHVLDSRPLRGKAALLQQRARAAWPVLDARFWAIVRWHQRALCKEWEPAGLGAGERPFWHSWVSGQVLCTRPSSQADAADLCAALGMVGLEHLAPRFERDGWEDVALVYELSPEEQRAILGDDVGLTVQDATRLLAALDEKLLGQARWLREPRPAGVPTGGTQSRLVA